MKEKSVKLKYLNVGQTKSTSVPQPCTVHIDGVKHPVRVVPIAPFSDLRGGMLDCIGCVGSHGDTKDAVNCDDLPDCSYAIYVRATPKNKLKYIEWVMEEHT